jgi:hypothetical protein
MLGHGPQVSFSTHAHVIAELRGYTPIPAEVLIKALARRRRLCEKIEPPSWTTGRILELAIAGT